MTSNRATDEDMNSGSMKSNTSRSSFEGYRPRESEYAVIHNVSRPLSPMHMVVTATSRDLTSRGVDKSWPGPDVSIDKPSSPENNTRQTSANIFGVQPSVSYQHSDFPSPFPNRKSKPPLSNTLTSLPDTIRVKGRANHDVADSALMNVSKFDISQANSRARTAAPTTPAIISQVRFDETLRNVNDRLHMVIGPALGHTMPQGHASRIRNAKIREQLRMRRYGHGISPLQRLNQLQTDLEDIVVKRQKHESNSPIPSYVLQNQLKVSTSSSKVENSSRSAYVATSPSNSTVIRVDMPSSHRSHSPNHRSGNTSSSDTYCDATPDMSPHKKTSNSADGESNESGIMSGLSVRTDLKVSGPDITDSPVSPSAFELAKIPKRNAHSAESPASLKAKFYNQTRLHTTGGVESDLYRLDHQIVDAESATSFSHTREKLMSRKDKIYDCGSKFHSSVQGAERIGTVESTGDDAKDIIVVSRTQSRESSRDVTSPDMPSRYLGGANCLSERPSTGAKYEVPGHVRRKQDKEFEIKSRVPCAQCTSFASMWCDECERSYCDQCWNSVPHHEYVSPHDVWQNRCPKHAIDTIHHSVAGMHVHINSRGSVSQGLPVRNRKGLNARRTRTKPKPLFQFPSTDTLMENGFNHAEHWAELHDESSVHSDESSKVGSQTANNYENNIGSPPPINDEDVEAASNLENDVCEDEAQTEQCDRVISSSRGPRSPTYTPRVLSERAKSPKTLMWQVATGNECKGKIGSLVGVSRMQPPKHVKQLKGITKEFFPDEWKASRLKYHKEFTVYKGVTVATKSLNTTD